MSSNKGVSGDFTRPSSFKPLFKVNDYEIPFDQKSRQEKRRSRGPFPHGCCPSPEDDTKSPDKPKPSSLLGKFEKSLQNSREAQPGYHMKCFVPNGPTSLGVYIGKEGNQFNNDHNQSFVKTAVSKLTQTQDSIELYFDYKSDPKFLEKSNSCGMLHCPTDEAVFEEDSCCVMRIRKPSLTEILLERRLQDRKFPMFIKYIPVTLPMKFQIPKILHNKKDMAEWEEAQQAYEDMRFGYPTTSSRSNEAVVIKKPAAIRKKLNKLIQRKFKLKPKLLDAKGMKHKKEKDNVHALNTERCLEVYDAMDCRPKESDERFSERLNLEFLNVNIDTSPKFTAHLYAIMEEENYAMCHMKTELLAACLQSFLFPYGEVQCFWVTNLPSMIQQLTGDANLRPLLRKLVVLKKFEAALVLSADASRLIRHKDTCFLKTITTVLQIPHHKLLVLRDTDEYEL